MWSVLLFYFVCLLLLSAGAVFAAARFGLRFEEALPVWLTGAVLVLFVFGVMGRLLTGVYVLCALAAGLHGMAWTGRRAGAAGRVFTPAALLFAAVLALLFALNYGRLPMRIDEMTHWADSVKAMYYADLLPSAKVCATDFPAYPPGMGLMEYLFLRLYSLLNPGKGYTEWVMYAAYQSFLLSFSFPFLRALDYKRPLRLALAAALVLLCPLMMDASQPYCSLYIDPFLCAALGGGLAAVFTEPQKERARYELYVFSACVMLVLAKPAGLLLAFFLAAAYSGELLLRRGERRPRKFAGAALAVLGPVGLWTLRKALDGVTQSFSSKEGAVDFGLILRLMLHREGESWQQIVHDDYYARLFTDTVRVKGFPCPYWLLLLFSAAALFALAYGMSRRCPRLRPAVRVLPWVLLLITAGYYISMCYTYIFKFDYWEALKLASLDRYIGIVLYAVYTAALLSLVRFFTEADTGRLSLCLAVAVLLVLSPFGRALDVLRRTDMRDLNPTYMEYRAMTARLAGETGGRPARVYWINQGSWGEEYYGVRYILRPNTGIPLHAWFLGKTAITVGNGIYPDHYLSAGEWMDELHEGYDYLYLEHIDDYFLENYSSLFAPGSEPADKRLYRVEERLTLLDKEEADS